MRITVGSIVVGYEDTGGGGVPLVLLHGFPLDRGVWRAQVRGLAGVARVITPDLRGFGESSMPQRHGAGVGEDMTIDAYADDVLGLLDTLDIGRAVIAGHSMGGYVALSLYRRFAGRVRGLVLVDTRAGPDAPEARHARDEAIAVARSRGATAIAAQMLPKMVTAETAHADTDTTRALLALMEAQPVESIVAALTAMRDRPDSTPTLGQVSVPTLVVCGMEDLLIHPKESEVFRAAIPRSRLVRIPDAAHLPNYEKPDAFNAAVRDFLSGL